MDEKTKEIVERLRAATKADEANQTPRPDTTRAMIISDDRWIAADIITSLSERVGELERNLKEAHDWFSTNRPQWGPGTLPTWFVDSERALLSNERQK